VCVPAAPEQVMAGQAQSVSITPSSDVYAFGVLLLELFSGRKALDPSRDPQQALLAGLLSVMCQLLLHCITILFTAMSPSCVLKWTACLPLLDPYSQTSFAPSFCTKTTPWHTWTPSPRHVSQPLDTLL